MKIREPRLPEIKPGADASERLRLAMLFMEEWSNWWSYALGVDDDKPMSAEEKAAGEKMAESLGARARDMVIDNRRFLAITRPEATRTSVLDEIEKLIGAVEGRHFAAIGTATSEDDKRRHGTKVAFAMELRAAIRALKLTPSPQAAATPHDPLAMDGDFP